MPAAKTHHKLTGIRAARLPGQPEGTEESAQKLTWAGAGEWVSLRRGGGGQLTLGGRETFQYTSVYLIISRR